MNIIIIGNSAAGLSALQNFRKYDQTSKVTVISKEGVEPYSRVLIPYVLRQKLTYEQMTIRENNYFDQYNATCIQGEVVSVESNLNQVILRDGTTHTYDKLLIATGSYAVKPPIEGINEDGIYNMWTKEDTDRLLPKFNECKSVTVIGSGFVALQAAWAARVRGLEVTVIELMDRIMPSVLDETGANTLKQKIIHSGVKLLTSTSTQKIEKLDNGSFKIHLLDKGPIISDFVIVGTGVRSNTSFLENSGVEFDRGIPVNEFMQTNVENIYSAGDVAAGPTTFGQEHMVHALWPTAVEMGKVAGVNMAGKNFSYEGSLNMNVTQMYDVTVASMGYFNENDIDYAVYLNEEEEYLKICYKDNLLVGACLVGSSDSVELFGKLRPLIRKKEPIDCAPEKLIQYVNLKTFSKIK